MSSQTHRQQALDAIHRAQERMTHAAAALLKAGHQVPKEATATLDDLQAARVALLDLPTPSTTGPAAVTLHITTSNAPAGKLADVEMHFLKGPLAGSKLIGFAVWLRRSGQGWNVTLPARSYQVNGERRSFALLRPAYGLRQDSTTDLRDLVLHAYAQHVAAGTPPEITRWAYTDDRHPVEVSQAETPSDPHEDRVHQLRPDLGTSRTTCGRDSQLEGGATVEVARITYRECLDALYIETANARRTQDQADQLNTRLDREGPYDPDGGGDARSRNPQPQPQPQPQADQDQPVSLGPWQTTATAHRGVPGPMPQAPQGPEQDDALTPGTKAHQDARQADHHERQEERHRMPELPTPQLITTPLTRVRRVF